jgi:hypothetical protein
MDYAKKIDPNSFDKPELRMRPPLRLPERLKPIQGYPWFQFGN